MLVKLLSPEECHQNIFKLLERWVQEKYFIKVNNVYIKNERRFMRHKIKFRKKFDMWITAWLALVCSIIVILTFCYWQPAWDLKFWLREKK